MPKTIDFYFDFMSPFAYLAHHQLLLKQNEYGYQLAYHPLDLAYVKLKAGNTGPPNRSIPPKIKYLMQDLGRWAERYGVPLVAPGSLDSKLSNIGALIAIERGVPTQYALAVWERTWAAGGDFSSIPLLREVAQSLSWDPDEFISLIETPEWEQRYQASSDHALDQGVFGVPTMIVDGLMWWGNDRLFMLEEHLATSKLAK